MAEYVQSGNAIDYVNGDAKKIGAGDVVALTGRIGIAGTDIEVGKTGSLHVVGVFRFPKDDKAMAVGDKVYFDAAAQKITATETGNTPAGWVVMPAAANATLVDVQIGGR